MFHDPHREEDDAVPDAKQPTPAPPELPAARPADSVDTTLANAAIRRALLTQNPAHWVELPNGRRPRAVVCTEARVALWRATGERPRWPCGRPNTPHGSCTMSATIVSIPCSILVALLGLRRGEVLGLRWSDIDLKARTVVVSHQVHEYAAGG